MQEQLNLSSVSVKENYQIDIPTSIETHIVDRGDIYYAKGRNLAKEVYKEIWNTENLVDGNDYGIVVACNGEVLGNANIQLKHPGKLLKSEVFFGESHWEQYFEASELEIAEISALAVSQTAPTHLRRPVLMILMTGIQSLCRIKKIEKVTTVQHDYLVRILTKSLKVPFFRNEAVKTPKSTVPKDDYWKRIKPPALYYYEPLKMNAVKLRYSFFDILKAKNIETSFYPRVNFEQKLNVSIFEENLRPIQQF